MRSGINLMLSIHKFLGAVVSNNNRLAKPEMMMLCLFGLFLISACSNRKFAFRSKISKPHERKEVANGVQEKQPYSAKEMVLNNLYIKAKTNQWHKPNSSQKKATQVDTWPTTSINKQPKLIVNYRQFSVYQTKPKQPFELKDEPADNSGNLGIFSLISGVLSLLIVLVFVFKTGAFFFGFIPFILSICFAILAIILGRIAIKNKEWDYPLGFVGSTLGIIWLSILAILSLLIWMFVSIVLCLTV